MKAEIKNVIIDRQNEIVNYFTNETHPFLTISQVITHISFIPYDEREDFLRKYIVIFGNIIKNQCADMAQYTPINNRILDLDIHDMLLEEESKP